MGIQFPNESDEYRKARNTLLEAEKELREKTEEVASLRRRLPLGGKIPTDYVFEEGDPPRKVKLSELFGSKDTLVLYSFMFSAKMESACPSCTSILDGMNGEAPHLADRIAFAAVARSPIGRWVALGKERGWRNLRLLSSSGNEFNRDYHAEDPKSGDQNPMINVFIRKDGEIRHCWGSELFFAPTPEGYTRHVDMIWPIWKVLDLTPEGRGESWEPQLSYRS